MRLTFTPSVLFSFLFITYLDAFDGDIHDIFLPNGMKVIIMEKTSKPYVGIGVYYNVGAHDELAGMRGINRIVLNLMDLGTEKYPRAKKQQLYNTYNSPNDRWSNMDMTGFVSELPKSELERGLDIESDRMQNPTIDTESLGLAKKEYKTQLSKYKMDILSRSLDQPRMDMFPKDHPYRIEEMGILENVDTLSLRTCKRFFNQYYAPNNSVLVLVGDIDPQQIIPLIYQYFGTIQPSNDIPPDPGLTYTIKKSKKILKYDLFTPEAGWMDGQAIYMNFLLPSSRNEDIFIVRAIEKFLDFDKQQDRFMDKMITKNRRQVAAFVPFTEPRLGQSNFFIISWNIFKRGSTKKIKRSFLSTFKYLGEFGVHENLIEQYRKNKLIGIHNDNRNFARIATKLGWAELIHGSYKYYQQELEIIKKLNNEDIKRVINTYLNDDNLYIAEIHFNKPRWWARYIIGPIFNTLLPFFPGIDPNSTLR